MSEPAYFAHDSAYIDEPCQIGPGTKIWHYCHVMSGAQIGDNCVLGQNVFVASDVVIGNNVKIQNNVSLYTGVELEDDVFCGPSCVFTNVINPRSQIVPTANICAPWYAGVRPLGQTPPSFVGRRLEATLLLARAHWCAAMCQTMP